VNSVLAQRLEYAVTYIWLRSDWSHFCREADQEAPFISDGLAALQGYCARGLRRGLSGAPTQTGMPQAPGTRLNGGDRGG
jgi:hypothetical protein